MCLILFKRMYRNSKKLSSRFTNSYGTNNYGTNNYVATIRGNFMSYKPNHTHTLSKEAPGNPWFFFHCALQFF